jgi:hypothetical protein
MARWRSSLSPRAATTPSADCPIAVASLHLVSCRRTLAYDMPTAAIAPPSKFDTWHFAWPQKPQGGAGQDDGSEPRRTMTTRRVPPPWTVIEHAESWDEKAQTQGARLARFPTCAGHRRGASGSQSSVDPSTTTSSWMWPVPDERQAAFASRADWDAPLNLKASGHPDR